MTSAFFNDIKLKCTFFEIVNSNKNFTWVIVQTMQGKEQKKKEQEQTKEKVKE